MDSRSRATRTRPLPLKVGDRVRVVRVPHIDAPDYPHAIVQRAFSAALGNIYRVEEIDWGGWVWLRLSEGEGIGVQQDCVELVERVEEKPD